MDREECHKKLDQLLNLICAVPSNVSERQISEHAAKVCDFSIRFFDWIAGDYIAHQIYAGGHSLLDDENINHASNNAEIFNKRGLAVAVSVFTSILEKAKLAVKPIQRDLIEMSKNSGSSPLILTVPKRSKGQKDNRDLKKQARIRVCQAVYQEHGRTKQSVVSVRNRLRNTEENEADRKTWERMVKNYPIEKRKKAILEGARLKEASHDAIPINFKKLWQYAVLK